MKVWWYRCANFGDALTPYLFRKITGTEPEYASPGTGGPIYCLTGSLIGSDLRDCVVWGLGAVHSGDCVVPHNNAQFISVRGPITQGKVIAAGYSCSTYGDPALLLPRYYNVSQTPKYELGIAPSWVDVLEVKSKYVDPRILIIDTMGPTEVVIDQIRSCRRIITGCLHGLVTAVAYNIPVVMVKFSERMVGDGTKFRDFMLSIGHDTELINMDTATSFECMCDLTRVFDIKLDVDAFWASCPFKT